MPHSDPPQSSDLATRLFHYRTRAKLTRPQLAELIGCSIDWVKATENGARGTGLTSSIRTLARAADALGVDFAQLIGVPELSARRHRHGLYEQVAGALTLHPLDLQTRRPRTTDELQHAADTGWRAWHTAPAHRTAVGMLLPRMIRDARLSIANHEEQTRDSLRSASQIYALAHHYLTWHAPGSRAMHAAAEWSVAAAQTAQTPGSLAAAQWVEDHVQREAGEYDPAHALEVARLLYPEEGGEDLAMWGLMRLSAAVHCGMDRRADEAMRYWTEARSAAEAIGGSYTHPWLLFGVDMVDMFGVLIHIHLGQAENALQLASRVDRSKVASRGRLGLLDVSVAQAHVLRLDYASAVGRLEQAQRAAPEDFPISPYTRRVLLALLEEGVMPARTGLLAEFAGLDGDVYPPVSGCG